MEHKKNILVNSMFEAYANADITNSKAGNTIVNVYKFSKVLNYLNSTVLRSDSVVALVSDNLDMQANFQIACLLTGTNCIIFNSKNYEYWTVSHIGVNVIFTTKELEGTDTSQYYPSIIIDPYTLSVKRNNVGLLEILEEYTMFLKHLDSFKLDSRLSIEELKEEFKNNCVSEYKSSKIYVIHPGSSSISPKIAIFHDDQVYQGMLKIVDDFYHSLKDSNFLPVKQDNQLTIDVKILISDSGEVTLPLYTFMLGVFLPLYSSGMFYSENTKTKANTLYSSTELLTEKFNNIVDDSKILSFLEKFKLKPFFKTIFRYQFSKKYKGAKLLILYGKTHKRLRKYIRYTGMKVSYVYTMSEVASFISFELYNKFPVKSEPTVGSIPRHLVLNSSPSNVEGRSEILINVPDRLAYYDHKEFTSVCATSDKYVGMFSTFDIGSNVKGKLLVHGKADELLYNENGLVIQDQIIYSIILNSNLVRDALIIPVDGVLVLIVEPRKSTMLFNNITLEQTGETLRKNELVEINKKVKPFSKVHNLFIVPEFERVNGKIKIGYYLLEEVLKNLNID